jgi:hypothetical protein
MKPIYTLLFVFLSFTAFGLEPITAASGDVQVTAEFKDTPEVNMPFDMSLSFAENGKNIEVSKLKVTYNMTNMNMGTFIQEPVLTDGIYPVRKLTLPRCMSGSKVWNATVEFEYGGTKHKTVITFELQ